MLIGCRAKTVLTAKPVKKLGVILTNSLLVRRVNLFYTPTTWRLLPYTANAQGSGLSGLQGQ